MLPLSRGIQLVWDSIMETLRFPQVHDKHDHKCDIRSGNDNLRKEELWCVL